MSEMQSFLKSVGFKDLENWSVQYFLETSFSYNESYPLVKIGSFLTRNKTQIIIQDDIEYKRVTIKINNGGIFLRDKKIGKEIGTKKQFVIKKGQFLLSKIDARNGAFGVVTAEVDEAIITGNFWTFDVDYTQINPHFLSLITTTKEFIRFCANASNGTTNRHYLQEEAFLNVKIPLPLPQQQEEILKKYNDKIELAKQQEQKVKDIEESIEDYLFKELSIEKIEVKKEKNGLQFVEFKTIYEWGVDKIFGELDFSSRKYDTVSFIKNENLFIDIFRGKSPKYKADTKKIILNQKCNRWNEIQLEYTKTVDEEWFEKIDKNFFTKENDILINSTGEGTIGRASNIYKEYSNLLYDSHLLLLRLNHSLVNSEYFAYLFNSFYGQQQVDKIKSAQATKQTELGVNNLKKIVFPLPPLNIQKKIANEITKRKEKIKQLKNEAQTNREKAIKEFEEEIFDEA